MGNLNALNLIMYGQFTPTEHAFTNEWTNFNWSGISSSFIGQKDEKGDPKGLVRMIFSYGGIYEGYMERVNDRIVFSKWGRFVIQDGTINMGWWKNNCGPKNEYKE